MGQRIIVSDSQESVHFMLYKRAENQLIVFADETTPRYIISVCFVDYDTVAVGDRFGNISIVSYLFIWLYIVHCLTLYLPL